MDVAPRFAGSLLGAGNSLAALTGFIAPTTVAALTTQVLFIFLLLKLEEGGDLAIYPKNLHNYYKRIMHIKSSSMLPFTCSVYPFDTSEMYTILKHLTTKQCFQHIVH